MYPKPASVWNIQAGCFDGIQLGTWGLQHLNLSETTVRGWLLRRALGSPFHTWQRLEGRELFLLKIKIDQAGTACASASTMCVWGEAPRLMDVFCGAVVGLPNTVMLYQQNEDKGKCWHTRKDSAFTWSAGRTWIAFFPTVAKPLE